MPAYKEIFEIEKQRKEPAQWNVIHLFKEGATYKAYEWSAWICREFATTEERLSHFKSHKLTPVLKEAKNTSGTIIFVGFPPASLDKFIPKESQVSFATISDTQIDIAIELPADIVEGDVSEEKLQKKFAEWKESWPLKKDGDKPADGGNGNRTPPPGDAGQDLLTPYSAANGRPVRMTDIVTGLASLPLEDISPNEALRLLKQLRRQALSLF